MADQSSNFAEFYIARTAWHAPAAERMRFHRAAALARVPAGAAVLDVGARDGGLRRVLPNAVRYQGIEIDPAFAEPNILIHDISRGLPFPSDSYDFAFCLEILEHLPDPFQAVGEIHRLLKPAGVLIVSVPNPYHFKEIIWNLLRIPDRQGHLYAWTRQTMARFGEMSGFRLERTGGTYLHPPIPAVALLARSIIYRFVKV